MAIRPTKTGAKGTDRIPHFSPVCTFCRHWKPGTATCDAFPKDPPGIPMSVWSGANRHTSKLSYQHNTIVFEVAPDAVQGAKKAGLIP